MGRYADMVKALAKPGEDIRTELTAADCHLWHMACGVSGEAGELLDAVKKAVVYRKQIDIDNVIEELGDLEFFMEGLRQALNVSRELTLEHNMNKLMTRYATRAYSNEAAQQRADKA